MGILELECHDRGGSVDHSSRTHDPGVWLGEILTDPFPVNVHILLGGVFFVPRRLGSPRWSPEDVLFSMVETARDAGVPDDVIEQALAGPKRKAEPKQDRSLIEANHDRMERKIENLEAAGKIRRERIEELEVHLVDEHGCAHVDVIGPERRKEA